MTRQSTRKTIVRELEKRVRKWREHSVALNRFGISTKAQFEREAKFFIAAMTTCCREK
jgi:hypothetical protein